MKELRFGIIGCGGVGTMRAAALSRTGSLKLTAVSDIDAKRAKEVARKHGAMAYSDWRSLLKNGGVDAVVVSTPPSSHSGICIEALDAGKHVLCEKPLARTTDECSKMLEAAEKSGRLLATGFNYRFFPSVQKARALLDSGMIGDLDHIRSYAGYSAHDHDHPWLHDFGVMGGGALRDNGIHLIDLTSYFLGGVTEIKGFTSNSVWGYEGCEDNGFALLRSPTGRIASLQASWTEWRGYRLLVEIYGTRGCIRASCFPMLTQLQWSRVRGGPVKRKIHLFPMTHIWEHLFSYRLIVIQSFVREFKAFFRAVNGDSVELATGRDGLRAVKIAEAVCQLSPGESLGKFSSPAY